MLITSFAKMTAFSLVLLVVLVQFTITISGVAGDCYDDPPNNKSYDNCVTCYQTLANALMNTGDNKYCLGQSFFPDDAATSIQVRVEYVPLSQCNTTNRCDDKDIDAGNSSTRWYWLAGEIYVYLPLELLLHRSLLFAPPAWRHKTIVLCLPDECIYGRRDSFFEYLTQRVSYKCSLFITYQSVGRRSI